MNLDAAEFSRIYDAGKIDGTFRPVMFESGKFGFKGGIDLYVSKEFNYAYGEATMYLDRNQNPAGFYDRYNMNPSTHRSGTEERGTSLGRLLGNVFNGKPYDVQYGEREKR